MKKLIKFLRKLLVILIFLIPIIILLGIIWILTKGADIIDEDIDINKDFNIHISTKEQS